MAGVILQSGRTVDDSGTNSTTIGVTLTGVTAGSTLVGMLGWEDAGGGITSTVSDGSAFGSRAPKIRLSADTQDQQIFARDNVAAGSHTVLATFSSTTAFRRFRVLEVAGLDPTGSADVTGVGAAQTPGGTGAGAVSSGATSATTNANDFVMGFSQDTTEVTPGTGTVTAGATYTISGSDVLMSVESKSVSATGTQTAPFTQSVNNNRITQVVPFKEASSTQSFSYTAAGGLTLGGTAARAKVQAISAAGGLQLSGAAPRANVRAEPAPSGGITLGGTAAFAKGQTVVPSGGLALAGVASQIRARVYAASGGLALSGAATVTTSGSQQYSYSASGGLQFGGAAVSVRVHAVVTLGGLQFAGAASASTHEALRTVVAAGGLQFGGAAAVQSQTVGGGAGGGILRRRRLPR